MCVGLCLLLVVGVRCLLCVVVCDVLRCVVHELFVVCCGLWHVNADRLVVVVCFMCSLVCGVRC